MRRNPLARAQDATLWQALQAHDEAGVRQALRQGANPAVRVPQMGNNAQPALLVLADDHLERVSDWARWGLEVPVKVWIRAIRQLPRDTLAEVLQGPPGHGLIRTPGAIKAWWQRALRQPSQTRAWLTLWCESAQAHHLAPWQMNDLLEVCAYKGMTLPLWDLALSQLSHPYPEATSLGWQHAWQQGNVRLANALSKRAEFDPEQASAVFRNLLASHSPIDLAERSCEALFQALTTPASQALAMAGLADLPGQVAAWSPLCQRRGWWGPAEANATYRTILRYPESAAFQLAHHETLGLLLAQGLNPWAHGGVLPIAKALAVCIDHKDLTAQDEVRHAAWWHAVIAHPARPALGLWRSSVEQTLGEVEEEAPAWVQGCRAQIQALARHEDLARRPATVLPRPRHRA